MVSVLLVAIGAVGCGKKGPQLSPISGRVTFQGKPVAAGLVRFSNSEGPIDILATIETDGRYKVDMAQGEGLPEGRYSVAVMPPRVNSPIGATTAPPQIPCPDIPDKYRKPSTSGLTLTVKPGDNPFDIAMQ